jgi:hypothetical protein
MKHVSGLIVALLLLVQATAQEPLVVKDKQYYLNKSKSQKTTAWILGGAGTAMVIGGAIAFGRNFELFGPGGETEALIMVAGVPVALASIPFFISAAKNKGKAEAMAGPSLQTIPYGTTRVVVSGVTVKIRL